MDIYVAPIIILAYLCGHPAGTWRKYNVASTLMQRHDIANSDGSHIREILAT